MYKILELRGLSEWIINQFVSLRVRAGSRLYFKHYFGVQITIKFINIGMVIHTETMNRCGFYVFVDNNKFFIIYIFLNSFILLFGRYFFVFEF